MQPTSDQEVGRSGQGGCEESLQMAHARKCCPKQVGDLVGVRGGRDSGIWVGRRLAVKGLLVGIFVPSLLGLGA